MKLGKRDWMKTWTYFRLLNNRNMYNFGKIKENIYEIAADGIASKDNKKKSILKKYLTTIKESEILRMEASIYDNIETKCDTNDYSASEYVKENISLLQ